MLEGVLHNHVDYVEDRSDDIGACVRPSIRPSIRPPARLCVSPFLRWDVRACARA